MKIWIENRPGAAVIAVQAVGPYDTTIEEAWQHARHLWREMLPGRDLVAEFSIEFDLGETNVPDDRRRISLWLPLPRDISPPRNAPEIRRIPSGVYLMTPHTGEFAGLPLLYRQLSAACGLDLQLTPDPRRSAVLFAKRAAPSDALEDCTFLLGYPVIQALGV